MARRSTAIFAALALLGVAAPGPAGAEEPRLAQRSTDWIDLRNNVSRLIDRVRDLEGEVRNLRSRLDQVRAIQAGALTPRIRDGRRTSDGETVVAPVIFVVEADPRGGPRSATLDLAEFAPRCADADGCLVTLALDGIVAEDSPRPFEAALGLGPCLMHHDPETGAWSVSAACAHGSDQPLGRHGRDGGSPLSQPADGGRILIDFGGACLLSEAPPARFRKADDGEPALAPGGARDLHLLATSAAWHLGQSFPDDLLPEGTRFDCRLTLRD